MDVLESKPIKYGEVYAKQIEANKRRTGEGVLLLTESFDGNLGGQKTLRE